MAERQPWETGGEGRGREGEVGDWVANGTRRSRDGVCYKFDSLFFFFASGSHGTEVEGINTARKRGWGGALLPPSHNIPT